MRIFDEIAVEEETLLDDIELITSALENYQENNFQAIFKNRGKSKEGSSRRKPLGALRDNLEGSTQSLSSDDEELGGDGADSKLRSKQEVRINCIRREITGIDDRMSENGGKMCAWSEAEH